MPRSSTRSSPSSSASAPSPAAWCTCSSGRGLRSLGAWCETHAAGTGHLPARVHHLERRRRALCRAEGTRGAGWAVVGVAAGATRLVAHIDGAWRGPLHGCREGDAEGGPAGRRREKRGCSIRTSCYCFLWHPILVIKGQHPSPPPRPRRLLVTAWTRRCRHSPSCFQARSCSP